MHKREYLADRDPRQDTDANVSKQDIDEPRYRGKNDIPSLPKADEPGILDEPVDEEPGPDDDDGLPENARRRVPS
jgi:hypothetical protein